MTTIRLQSKYSIAAAFAFFLAHGFGQTVSPPPLSQETSPALAKDEEVVQIDPFKVDGSGDKGYEAQSSLAGTRLNTSLKTIGSPISSFTTQFLQDTAITDTSELARFMLSTEYDVEEDSGAGQNSVKGDARPLRMRGIVLGGLTASPSVNFFKVDGRLDTFSLDRIDQSRGPNSVLFGMGTPAGTLNVMTKRALLNRNSGEVAVAGKSQQGLRQMVDYNQVLVPNRLGVRVAAVQDNQNSWRNYEYNDNERYFGTLKWQIAARTELNFETEHGHVDKATKRSFTAYDAYTPWRNAGKPISARPAPGVVTLSTAPYIVYDTSSGALMNWRNATTSQRAPNSNGNNIVLTDFSVLPKETTIYGPGFKQLKDYTRMTLLLSHSFTPNLHLEMAVFRNDSLTNDSDPQTADGLNLQVDTNPTLPTGQPNPNAGRTYLEGLPQINIGDVRDDSARAILVYEKDLGKFFGKHTLSGVFQYNHEDNRSWLTREQIISGSPNTNLPENNNNRVWRRTYVDITGPSTGIVMANFRDAYQVSGMKELVGGQTVQTAWIPFNANTQINSNRSTSYIGTLQSAFWHDRVHTVIGASHDERTDYFSTQLRTVLPPFTQGGVLYPVPGRLPYTNSANSVSFSGVLQVVNWLGLTYSQAANAGLPEPSGRLHTPTGHPPIPRGESRDIGVKLDLFDHRLFVTASHFRSSAKKDFDFNQGVDGAQINPIWNALDAAGVLKANGMTIDQVLDTTSGSTHDTASKGYEVELTANPTEHWRIYANYTNNLTKMTNIGQEMKDFIAASRGLWTQGTNGRIRLDGSGTLAPVANNGDAAIETVAEQLGIIDNLIFSKFVVQDGREPLGQSRHKFTFRTGYDFSSGLLKGFSVGGGARYRSANLNAYYITSDAAETITRTPGYGSPQMFVDVNAGYARKLRVFNRPVRWSIQLNVNNVLNNQDFIRLRLNTTGQLASYMFNPPLEWILTNRFTF